MEAARPRDAAGESLPEHTLQIRLSSCIALSLLSEQERSILRVDLSPPLTAPLSCPSFSQKKKVESRYDENRGVSKADEGPLDDPIAEKLRQQRLVEEADYASTMELFGKSEWLAMLSHRAILSSPLCCLRKRLGAR